MPPETDQRRTPRRRALKRAFGFIQSTELLLVAVILVIGLVVGLQAVRSAVVTELADVGGGIASVSQTFVLSGASGHHTSANGSLWQDAYDTCDDVESVQDNLTGSRCVAICDSRSVGGIPNPFAADTDARPEDGAPLPFTFPSAP